MENKDFEMEVQKYLRLNGLQKLKDELGIEVREYDKLVVLNYGLKSPKFNPICIECRALILEKDSWNIVSRAFDRFFNVEEGEAYKEFNFQEAIYLEKLDGSLMSVYWYDDKWNVSSRGMAFAEGENSMGTGTFNDLFMRAAKNTDVFKVIEDCKNTTFVFELTSPENRVVTRYEDTKVSLIGARNNTYGFELQQWKLDTFADMMKVSRPLVFDFNSMEQVVNSAKALDPLNEGYVAVIENNDTSFKRIKIKNPKYVAIAHMKNNGKVNPKRLLLLILSGEKAEFLSYFPEFTKYCNFVEEIYNEFTKAIIDTWEKAKNIEIQKDFALYIQKECKIGYTNSVLFNMKKGASYEEGLKKAITMKTPQGEQLNLKGVVKALCIKEKFQKHFNVTIEDDNDEE